MQNERTWQFWDEYYATQDKKAQEWILEPTIELLERLAEHMPAHSRTIHILEIGCGTSVLAREFGKLLLQKNNDAHMLATDISPVCIDFNRQRDEILILRETTSSPHDGQFEYRTLNALEQHPELHNSFDIILDKGCLDTFAFRSKQRGQNQPYAPLIRTVLDNIHSWLKQDGVYWVLTPRQKFRAVRDLRGFQSVQRVDVGSMRRGELVSTQEGTFLHVCRKNESYSANPAEIAFDREDDDLIINDTSSCSKCHLTFYDFRKGERQRGEAVWLRQWKGHCRHCKRVVTS